MLGGGATLSLRTQVPEDHVGTQPASVGPEAFPAVSAKRRALRESGLQEHPHLQSSSPGEDAKTLALPEPSHPHKEQWLRAQSGDPGANSTGPAPVWLVSKQGVPPGPTPGANCVWQPTEWNRTAPGPRGPAGTRVWARPCSLFAAQRRSPLAWPPAIRSPDTDILAVASFCLAKINGFSAQNKLHGPRLQPLAHGPLCADMEGCPRGDHSGPDTIAAGQAEIGVSRVPDRASSRCLKDISGQPPLPAPGSHTPTSTDIRADPAFRSPVAARRQRASPVRDQENEALLELGDTAAASTGAALTLRHLLAKQTRVQSPGLNVSLDLLTGDVLMKQGMVSGLRLQIHREQPPHCRRPWDRVHSSAASPGPWAPSASATGPPRQPSRDPGYHPDAQDLCEAALDPGPCQPRSPDRAPVAPASSAVSDKRGQDAWQAVLCSELMPLSLRDSSVSQAGRRRTAVLKEQMDKGKTAGFGLDGLLDLQTGSHPGPLKGPFGACARVELPRPPLRGARRAGLRAVPGEGDRAARDPVEATRTQISGPSQFSPTEVAPEDGEEAGEPGPGPSRLPPERCAVVLQQDGQGPAFQTSAACLQVDPEPARPPEPRQRRYMKREGKHELGAHGRVCVPGWRGRFAPRGKTTPSTPTCRNQDRRGAGCIPEQGRTELSGGPFSHPPLQS
ncbi:PREDICTED: uncharacterized protein LOC104987880 [Bison bison bison]|uniref:Uncharacterized protein LOC104987880 n=1 Tax=Bison bison bison TaxID=43346 RepID=A0A6P3H5S6_BISBB|nr:PREDICTED: uncharacterized protein LOC104987880 [Bison bison bison]